MTDEDGHRLEAADQCGFVQAEDDGPYTCTEAQLIAFAKGCERKGRAEAIKIAEDLYGEGPSAPWDNGGTSDGWNQCTRRIVEVLTAQNVASDTELAPILVAEEERSMTAAGYVRGTDEPGKRWVKPSAMAEKVGLRKGRAEAMQLLRAEMNNPLNGPPAKSVAHGVFGALKKRNDAVDAELASARKDACDHQSTFSFGCMPGITKCDKCGKMFGVLNINTEILA